MVFAAVAVVAAVAAAAAAAAAVVVVVVAAAAAAAAAASGSKCDAPLLVLVHINGRQTTGATMTVAFRRPVIWSHRLSPAPSFYSYGKLIHHPLS